MGFGLFIHTCQGILRNPGVSPLPALMRHAMWHGVRRFLPLPAAIEITGRSRLFIEQRREMNGCVALVWSQRRYDYHNMSFLGHLGASGLVRTCFDIGANIGIYSLLMSECPEVTVHAFEPHPATFATLRRMIEKNDRANVHAHQIALSDAGGMLSFTNDDFSPVNKALAEGENTPNAIQVPCETGAAFCERKRVYPDLLNNRHRRPRTCRAAWFWRSPQLREVRLRRNECLDRRDAHRAARAPLRRPFLCGHARTPSASRPSHA